MLRRLLIIALLAGAALVGCETSLDPFVDEEAYFSIYGFLDTGADTQYVRVVALRDSVRARPGARIDAAVALTDLGAGRTAVLRDSLFRFFTFRDDEGHIFWTDERVAPDRTYRFEVQRSDGATSTATVTTPPVPPAPVITVLPRFGARVQRQVRWAGTMNVAQVEMVYHVRALNRDSTVDDGTEHTVVVPYTDVLQEVDGGLEIVLDLTRDYGPVYNSFDFEGAVPAWRIELTALEIRLGRASDEWTFVSSTIDFETLAIPGQFTNVERGFGFLGAITRATYPWILPPEEVALLGYTDGQAR